MDELKQPQEMTHQDQEKFVSAEVLAQRFAQSQKPKKIKPYQVVGHDFIKTISTIYHFLKKDLGLKVTGDQLIERKFEKNNQLAIRVSEEKNFKVAKVDSRYVIMNKKMRQIEQETRIQREDFDQLYEVTNKKEKLPKEFDENLFLK